ncbi:MAG: DUF3177 family protein [Cyanobium sp.]
MPDLLYRSLVWLDVRLGVLFAVAVPLVLLIWSVNRREAALQRLLALYWKTASLMLIALLLLVDGRPIAYPLLVIAPLLSLTSLWFWVDLNEELADMPPWRALPLTVRIWRWSLTLVCLLTSGFALTALPCLRGAGSALCRRWLEAPQVLNASLDRVFDFIFGTDWTPGAAAFLGYFALVAYGVGLLQWLLVRLPRQGRVAGDF